MFARRSECELSMDEKNGDKEKIVPVSPHQLPNGLIYLSIARRGDKGIAERLYLFFLATEFLYL